MDKNKIIELAQQIIDEAKDAGVVTPPPSLASIWQQFIEASRAYAGIPDHVKVVMVAQAINESARGTSKLAKEANNFLGMKYRDELASVAVKFPTSASDHTNIQDYAKFNTIAKGVEGYHLFIKRSPYKGWEQTNTPIEFLEHIKKAGYAESPTYVQHVSALFVEASDLIGIPLKDMDRPDMEIPEEDIEDDDLEDPIFVTVDCDYKEFRYNTPNKLAKGLVLHYPVAGSSAKSTEGVVKYLAKVGYGCMAMDIDGKIYVPKSFNFMTDAAAHAGTSAWNGNSGLNDEYAGVEIGSYGKLDSKTKPKVKSENIRVSAGEGNIIKGEYEKFSPKQEKSSMKLYRMMMRLNSLIKNTSDLCGHDEARAKAGFPGGKSDPGASLSMTTLKFRQATQEFIDRTWDAYIAKHS